MEGAPIEGAHVQWTGGSNGAITDEQGRFSILLPRVLRGSLKVTHVGFESMEISLTPAFSDTIMVRMIPKLVELQGVPITVPLPEEVFRDEELHVATYELGSQGLWVLAYQRPQLLVSHGQAGVPRYRDVHLYLLNDALERVAEMAVPDDVLGVHIDHQGHAFLTGARRDLAIGHMGGDIELRALPRGSVEEHVLPWTDSIPGWLLGSDQDVSYPAFRHIALDPQRERLREICRIKDDRQMELFRSQYKYMSGRDKVIAMNLGRELGCDKEIVAGHMTGYHQSIYFRKIYAPLFVLRDTLLVFDHANDHILSFDRNYRPIGQVPIDHHLARSGREWEGVLLEDRVAEKIYGLFARRSSVWLREINVRDGSMGEPFTLHHPHAEQVRVKDGMVYYLYRPFGSLQKKTIYRELVR